MVNKADKSSKSKTRKSQPSSNTKKISDLVGAISKRDRELHNLVTHQAKKFKKLRTR